MTIAIDQRPGGPQRNLQQPLPGAYRPALLTLGFRPFFLAAGLWSIVALCLWVAMLSAGLVLPTRFGPLGWHIHEMLFGFVMAAIAGFLLTAIPNWTQRAPVSGWPLAVLAALWLVGRAACLLSALIPPWLSIAADLSFPLALIVIVAREIVSARNWRNVPIIVPISVLGAANLLMHLEANGIAVVAGLGWRLGVAATIILISVIAGRVVPTFTRNWLTKRHSPRQPEPPELPAPHDWVDSAALGSLHAGLLAWAIVPAFRSVRILLLLAAPINLWRLLRWRGMATVPEPLLLVLHIAYAWVALGAALLGYIGPSDTLPHSAASQHVKSHRPIIWTIRARSFSVKQEIDRAWVSKALLIDRVIAVTGD
jgi:uncharacterized protein involved in response to NO